jgi:hypothetical protein
LKSASRRCGPNCSRGRCGARWPVWLTQFQLAELFDTTVSNINKHIKTLIERCQPLFDAARNQPKARLPKVLPVLHEGEQPEVTIE